METSRTTLRLASSVCLLALAACSSGGGGGSANPVTTAATTPAVTTPAPTTTTPTTTTTTPSTPAAPSVPDVAIGSPGNPGTAAQTFPVYNFINNLPTVGTNIPIGGPAVKITSTSVAAQAIGNNATATFRGTVTAANGQIVPVFDINIPALSLTASNVRGDGTTVTLGDGGKVAASVATLVYTLLGAWSFSPAGGGTAYLGTTVTGQGTPYANVPTTGSATYVGNGGATGGVQGVYFIPSGTGVVAAGTLAGSATVTTNFATSTVSGSMTNMVSTPNGSNTSTPWNSISMTGSINRAPSVPAVSFGDTTATSSAGVGSAAFSSAATGNFAGGFYGPNAEEIGVSWTLIDPTAAGGGKTAFGVLGATKQ
ncbi:MAG: transferrin-binding protein-like solute binding protein [Alphaproteobacteria bacterium]|nr:transferrin-binding protein-like solute binding protein [Alphaproteobacteria bacterium]